MATPRYPIYPSAVGLAIASIFVIILMLPPMWWHARNRNLGATLLVGWLVLLNLFTFINALIWPNDDISNWYDGNVLCDIQVKFQIAARVGAPAANACVLRALAIVMDTDRATLGQSAAERRRNHTVELLWAVGFPLSMFLAHYIVQWNRYYLFGISGCVAGVSDSWVTLVLINLPGPVWTLVNVYYAVLILIRLHKYRVSFTSLLESRGTTRSRFLRLFCLCIFWLLVSLPVQFYVLFVNINVTHSPYSWTEIHDTERWRTIVMIPSDGRVIFDRYIWLGGGIMVFVFFGMGKDAMAMYKGGLCTIGLGRVFPSLKAGQQALPPASYGSTFSSIGSKAKMLFRRKHAAAETWQTDSVQSGSTRATSSIGESLKKSAHVGIVQGDDSLPCSFPPTRKTWPFSISALTRKMRRTSEEDTVQLHGVRCQHNTVSAKVTSGNGRHESLGVRYGDEQVVVSREVRQGSEHADEDPENVFRSAG